MRRGEVYGLQWISIHAPPRGATAKRGSIVEQFQFQFTPLREGRRGLRVRLHRWRRFQFTPLREGRPFLP